MWPTWNGAASPGGRDPTRRVCDPRSRSRARLLSVVVPLGVALLLLPSGSWGAPIGHVPRAAQSGLGLTVSSAVGVAPLLVRFSVTTPNATTPTLSWTFGDGAYLNGSFQDAHAPVHAYDAPGTFLAAVAAHYGGGDVIASATIRVVASNLTASVIATPANGTAPLSVWLNGTPAGGTGTYVAFAWAFGDGHNGSGLSVEYTFAAVGTFVAHFSVTDTLNETATASATIVVTNASNTSSGDAGAGARHVGSSPWAPFSPPVVAGTAVVGLGAVLAVVAWVWASRRRPAAARGPVATRALLVAPFAGPIAVVGPGPQELDLAAVPPHSPAAPRSERAYEFVGTRQLSFRVLTLLLELADDRQGSRFSPAGTQSGLADRLGVGQSAVSKVLRQLVLGGVVEVTSEHVAGASRRVRVYRLTAKGDRLARALRERPGRSAS